MGRHYPALFLTDLLSVLSPLPSYSTHITWLRAKYLSPTPDGDQLFEVSTNYQTWLLCMRATVVHLKKHHPEIFDDFRVRHRRVTEDVMLMAELADCEGNYGDANVFSYTDQSSFPRLFFEKDFTSLGRPASEFSNPIDWMVRAEYPIYLAWKVVCPKESKDVSFDNYCLLRPYIREGILEDVLEDERVRGKMGVGKKRGGVGEKVEEGDDARGTIGSGAKKEDVEDRENAKIEEVEEKANVKVEKSDGDEDGNDEQQDGVEENGDGSDGGVPITNEPTT
ncbi:hypothetical protein BCR34DRAFT_664454 [Clohesyomyces aquaticus]|uniref:Uncharacterized protein n=1 Tax=Clohesyomyces aquaticus TaxID=1231657 RepID=A0A1Y1ZNA3_9PLEO|nr:hypothetical protein BCR34DRAFT_664454 [Clohesyomyces aquaticus]